MPPSTTSVEVSILEGYSTLVDFAKLDFGKAEQGNYQADDYIAEKVEKADYIANLQPTLNKASNLLP